MLKSVIRWKLVRGKRNVFLNTTPNTMCMKFFWFSTNLLFKYEQHKNTVLKTNEVENSNVFGIITVYIFSISICQLLPLWFFPMYILIIFQTFEPRILYSSNCSFLKIISLLFQNFLYNIKEIYSKQSLKHVKGMLDIHVIK